MQLRQPLSQVYFHLVSRFLPVDLTNDESVFYFRKQRKYQNHLDVFLLWTPQTFCTFKSCFPPSNVILFDHPLGILNHRTWNLAKFNLEIRHLIKWCLLYSSETSMSKMELHRCKSRHPSISVCFCDLFPPNIAKSLQFL